MLDITNRFDLSDAMEALGLDNVRIVVDDSKEDSYGWTTWLEPETIHLDLASIIASDTVSVEQVIAHEMVHLAQYKALRIEQFLHCQMDYDYEDNPLEVQARDIGPRLAPYIKRIK